MNPSVNIPVFEIVITVFAAGLALLNGIIFNYIRNSQSERKEDRERLIRIETRLEGLDIMRNDIQGNRHKITDLDRGMTTLKEKVSTLEKVIEAIKARLRED